MIDNFVDLSGSYCGLENQTISNTNVTGDYYPAAKHNVWLMTVSNLVASKTAILNILQATDADGTGAKDIDDDIDGTVAASATITGRSKATILDILVDTVTNGKTVILQWSGGGSATTYTKATGTDTAAHEFADAAGLAACINYSQSTYLTATVDGTTVTVRLANPELGGTITESGVQETAKLITTTAHAQCIVEVAPDALDEANDFRYVAAKITTNDTTPPTCGCIYVREATHRPDTGHCSTVVRIH